jgi:uncharacterized protein YndB with AHSA1/START domain
MSDARFAHGRRNMIVGAAAALGGLLLDSAGVRAAAGDEISHANEAIHQEVDFKASPRRIYEALTDAKQFNQVIQLSAAVKSGMALGDKPTKISREVGGAFTIYFGHIVGLHIEMIPAERLVQAWRVVDWAPGVYSIAKFSLKEQGSGARLIFDHTGFPDGQGQHLAEGWNSNYWEPMQKFLAQPS